MPKVLMLSVRRRMKIFFMVGGASFWVLAFDRNLRKRIGCGFVFGNSLPNTRNCGRVIPDTNSSSS
jgi:hypothetical protein